MMLTAHRYYIPFLRVIFRIHGLWQKMCGIYIRSTTYHTPVGLGSLDFGYCPI
jgi:hypothetical protein